MTNSGAKEQPLDRISQGLADKGYSASFPFPCGEGQGGGVSDSLSGSGAGTPTSNSSPAQVGCSRLAPDQRQVSGKPEACGDEGSSRFASRSPTLCNDAWPAPHPRAARSIALASTANTRSSVHCATLKRMQPSALWDGLKTLPGARFETDDLLRPWTHG